VKQGSWVGLVLTIVLVAGAGGYWGGQREVALPLILWAGDHLRPRVFTTDTIALAPTGPGPAPSGASAAASPPGARPKGRVVYYRDPDGRSAYSAGPAQTPDGRDFRPVLASEDLSFDNQTPPEPEPAVVVGPIDRGEANGTRKVRFYHNPMGLPDTSPVPKKDSMGMDYIPVYAGEDEDGSVIKLSPGRLQRTGVRSEAVARRPVTTKVRASGTIQLDETRRSVVALRFDGYVDRVENVTTGSLVRQGQPLMHVYGPDLLAPAAQYLSALNDRSDAVTLRNARRRLENYAVPASVIAEIERTHEIPPTLTWPAPRTGVVVERTATDGMRASAGESLFRLADLSVVWAVADVPEGDLPQVAVGEGATVRPRGSDHAYAGRISVIYPTINPTTRTARVRVELPNSNGALLPDMYADVEIATGDGRPVLAVPDTAVIDGGDHPVVIVDKGEGRLEPRPVRIGRRGGGFVEVREGVSEGEDVVTAANFLIDAESNLKAALQGLNAPGDVK
jgi:Cu(I)/Ag(I) efflux system membrane fusion protein